MYFDQSTQSSKFYENVLFTGVHDHTGRPLAIVETCFKKANTLERHDVNFARAISLLAASAIRSAKLYGDMARNRRHSDALLEISQAVSGEERLEEMMENILKVAVEAVDAELVILHYFDESTKKFVHTVDSDGAEKDEIIQLGEEVEGYVALHGGFVQVSGGV